MTDDIQDPVAGRDYMSDSNPTPKRCQVRVPDGGRSVSSHACGRKLSSSEDYPELCGLHAAAKRRRLAKRRQEISEQATAKKAVQDADARVISLNNRLGIVAVAQTQYDRHIVARPTGSAIVPIAELEKLAERISELETALEGHARVERNLLEGK